MTVADTGVLLALLDEEHPRHAEATELLARGPITVTPPTLTEVTRVVRRHAKDRGWNGNKIARDGLKTLRALPGYRMAASPSEEDVAVLYAKMTSLSYADAWNLLAGLRGEEDLATFDKGLRRAFVRRTKA